ncbi:tetratricopeptide repeat protein [Streptomyces minutiscleroticus]|uniref:tetratricopeptide repeat protein n=1 Tax=Streptomyces minutiscleroticus TaxID=68238 RepID=UPI003D9EDCDF
MLLRALRAAVPTPASILDSPETGTRWAEGRHMGRRTGSRKGKNGSKAAGGKQLRRTPEAPSGKRPAAAVGQSDQVDHTGDARVTGNNSIANSGVLHITKVQSSAEPLRWPQVVGHLPAPASCFQERAEVRERIDSARNRHATVVLSQVLRGGGGVGKSQLAAKLAWEALEEGTELLVWVNATYPGQVIAEYAQAARRVRAEGADGEDAEADARAFLNWLACDRCRWLVVLDDVADPWALAAWWPRASGKGRGRVVATTRCRDAVLTGGDREVVAVDCYTPAEAVAYVGERLTRADAAHLQDGAATDLAAALGLLPLALSHAAAYMINEKVTCGQYLQLFTNRRLLLDEVLPASADTEGYGRQVAAALLLSLDAAQAADETGLAVSVLRLIAHLDPAGHPRELWQSSVVLHYLRPRLGLRRSLLRPRTSPEQTHNVLRLLHRYGLIDDDSSESNGVTDNRRIVRLHSLTARAARETVPARDLPVIVRAAAEGLAQLWPEVDETLPDFAAVLRANASALTACAEDTVWTQEEARLLVWRAGKSLMAAGDFTTAIGYWEALVEQAGQRLGAGHREALLTRTNLACSYTSAGRFREAIALQERGVVECERELGSRHRATFIARANLGSSYLYAGRVSEAIAVLEQVAADRKRHLGDRHPDYENTLVNLAPCYCRVGRADEAITLLEPVNARRGRADDPNTLTVRYVLAQSYMLCGRTDEALPLMKQVVADRERQLGTDHPETLAGRASLASCYVGSDLGQEATALLEPNVRDCVRVLGPEHPNTLEARAHLANAYWKTGRQGEAVHLLEQVVADRQRLRHSAQAETVQMARMLRQWKREQHSRHR